ncbi:hypothetical protein O181_051538 [Austropuccinia psidii MF-1]|uniref:Integrase catalytic domain-containing protein n=1 Tax=Austropuccinia psidii MF-1 TaxID=1389203 RepID=A0A9Q3HNG9_9BASI|nr:hypothetical protein [Austropuccinia psidii MF-1]
MKPNYKILTHNNKPFELVDHNKNVILNGTFNSGKFEVTIEQNQALATIINHNNILTLHQATGHPSPEYLGKMFPTLTTTNLQFPTCNLCKITKLPFKGTFPKPQRRLQFIHTDLFEPINTPSNSGYKYCLRVVDGYNRYVWTTFLKCKSETSFHIQKLIKRIENQCKEKITNLVSDNGSEFEKNQLTTFFQDNCITHLTTAPYTPEQNPFAKRGDRTTITKARCLLSDSGLDKYFWAKAVRTATYLESITPKKSLNYSTPYYKWFERLPTYQHLKPFFCLCYYLNNQHQDKFSEKGYEGLFLGYEEGHRAYQILDRRTEPQITSGDPIVTNTVFPRDDHPKLPTDNSLNPNLITNMPRDKRGDHCKWIPESQPPANEIHGDVGNPRSIIESRQ